MEGNESMVAGYDDLWLLTQQMLNAARKEEWDALIALEQKRGTLIERMKTSDDLSRMTGPERQHAGEIVQKVLVADAEIRTGAEAWMGELLEMLGSITTEKKLHKAYEGP